MGIVTDTKDLNELLVSTNAVKLICVLDGCVEKNGKPFGKASGFTVGRTETAEISANGAFSCVFVEFTNAEKEIVGAYFTCENAELFEKIAKILCEEDARKFANSKFSEGAALMLTSLLKLANDDAENESDDYVDMAKRYINENYGRQIKVEEIAESIGADRKYLRNLFFSRMGMSTKDYLTAVRIENAKILLMEKDTPVCDVAQAVGYPDALAFSKLFKKYVGVSPSEFRGSDNKASNLTEKKQSSDKPKKIEKPAVKKPEKTETPKKKEDIKVYLL